MGMLLRVLVLLVLGFQSIALLGRERRSIEPYLSGDTFRAHADLIFDETNEYVNFKEIDFGSTIFVKTDLLPKFFEKVHPHLVHPYVLITHNSDLAIPGKHEHMLEDEKILAWFGQNVENSNHPKMHPIPIGLGNYYWPHGNIETLIDVQSQFKDAPKEHVLYMNFNRETNVVFRSDIYFQFISEPYCFHAKNKEIKEYFSDIANSVFVLSPRGNGLDCHRTWEALYLGAIPIVGSSSLNSVYETLPVIVTDNWKEVTFSFLEEKLGELEKRPFSDEKLWTNYWFKQMDAYKSSSINSRKKRKSMSIDMKRGIEKLFLFSMCLLNFNLSNISANPAQKIELGNMYFYHCSTGSDINEHIPVLSRISSECSSVVEIGVRHIVSTWGILNGLSESPFPKRRYIGIDLELPPWDTLQQARVLAESQNISFQFWKGNDMDLDIPESDMLFIDTLHTYRHLTYELEKFSPKISKYIAMHDTSEPWGMQDEPGGDHIEYDPSINREKRGLWPAVVDFLERHPEWCLHERRLNNHGLTILKRVTQQ